jgi:CTP-dependent riboflavin kinase
MKDLFLVIDKSFDYDNIDFITDALEAWNKYEELKEDFDSSLSMGGAICKVTGEGNLYISQSYDGYKNVEVLDSFDEYSF